MLAVTWQAEGSMAVTEVPDPQLRHPDDAIIKVTSTGLCGSDLHLGASLAPYMESGDIVGHEPIGIVQEVGSGLTRLRPGDRVVVPSNVSCGTCWMCERGLHSQCETTQNREQGTGASMFGYGRLYGQVPGAQAEYLRVPFGDTLPIKVPSGPVDDRFVFLSDVLPTSWQALAYADLEPGSTVLVLGAGPVGDMCARIALMRGHRVLVSDPVTERCDRVRARGAEVLLPDAEVPTLLQVRELTHGRGADAVIDAVGMEAHGTAGQVDRLAALHLALDAVRRGGTVSVVGVYDGAMDPMPLMEIFDKQVNLKMGRANVRRWADEILTLLLDSTDHLGVESFATHHLPLIDAPSAYETFRHRRDGMVKVLFQP